MRVVGFTRFGGPEVLEVLDLPRPPIGPGEVRIRVRASTVNPTDTVRRSGALARQADTDPLPWVPGMDVAGELVEIGPDVTTDLALGEEVMAMVVPAGARGAYAEEVVVPAASVARIPAGSSVVEASTLPMNGLTARMALDRLALHPGQTLAVTGAAGCFGGYTVELAKADGLRVVADAAPADVALVEGLGADVVVPRGDDVASAIRSVCPDGVDGLADGAVQHHLVAPAIRPGGGLAAVRGFPGDAPDGVVLHPVWVREYRLEQAKLDGLRALVEQGALTLRVAATYPAAEAAEAHRVLEAGGTRGRLVLLF